MKEFNVFCEYCGSQIDVDNEDICPNCGASFENNKSYKKIKENKRIQEELEIKEREASIVNKRLLHQSINNVTGTVKSVSNVVKIVVPIVLFVTVLIFIFVFFNIFRVINKEFDNSNINNNSNILDNFMDEDSEKKVTVGLNEFGETSKYKVKVESYEVIDDYPFSVRDGFEIVTFHIILENVSGSQFYLSESINCVVDGIAQSEKNDFDRDSLPFKVAKDITVQGYQAFEVPTNATSYEIKFGDYVTVHIDK